MSPLQKHGESASNVGRKILEYTSPMDPMGYAKFKPQFLNIRIFQQLELLDLSSPSFSSRGPEVLAMLGVMTSSIVLGAFSTITYTPHGTSEPLCHMQYFSTHGNGDGNCGNIKLLILSENFWSSSPRRDRCAVGWTLRCSHICKLNTICGGCGCKPGRIFQDRGGVDRPGQSSLAVGLGLFVHRPKVRDRW